MLEQTELDQKKHQNDILEALRVVVDREKKRLALELQLAQVEDKLQHLG